MGKNCTLCKIAWGTDRLYREVYQVINIPNKYIGIEYEDEIILNNKGEEWFKILKNDKVILGDGYNYRLEKVAENAIKDILRLAELYSTDKEGVANVVKFEHIIF